MPRLETIRARRAGFAEAPDQIRQVLHDGSARARATACHTLAAAKAAMGIV